MLALIVGVLLLLCAPAVASADGLVDDPGMSAIIPAEVQGYFDRCEAEYQKWLSAQTDSVVPQVIDAPHRVLGTTSHKQIRNDYCVPATTTIIDHYLRGATNHWSQNQWAAYTYGGSPLWTDAGGGNMWVMAMGLNAKTGKAYSYTSGNTTNQVYSRTEYAINSKGRPVAYGLRIWPLDWPNYKIYHGGHILCGRGFDWRYNTIHVDDPYPENAAPPLGYGSAGGDTYGLKTYGRGVVAGGVVDSASRQVVY